ncbi:hypothetical protein [Armatimonas sp.]|uniref:hypothetical protein n=1 Tax=Armatimonas sp. TaxID=1872638 RepID=UPI003752B309
MNQEEVLAWLAAHPYGEQDENGVDLSLLRANLKLTPEQRWLKHQRALRTILEVKRAGERTRLRRIASASS